MAKKRIQRMRRRGWRKPEGAVYVGRPSRWGNYCVGWPKEEAVRRFEAYARERARREPEWLEPLIGHDLMCWCRLDEVCHADVLLRLCEEEETRRWVRETNQKTRQENERLFRLREEAKWKSG